MEIQEYTYDNLIYQVQKITKKRKFKEKLNAQELYLLNSIEQLIEDKVIKDIRERQIKIPGLLRSEGNHKAYWGGSLTPGCKNCLDGSGFNAIRSVSECNLNCKYCYYYGKEKLPKLSSNHFILGNNEVTQEDIQMIFEKQGQGIGGLAWVFYEPFMDFDKHPSVIKTIAQKGIHQHMYTNGTLCKEEQFKILADSGLNELRFDLAATNCSDLVIRNMALARKYFQFVGVEGPMYPEYYSSFVKKRKMILDAGIDHINCAELHITEKHTHFKDAQTYRYKKGYISPIYSRQLTYDLIELAAKEKWEGITIQDCSNETKFYRSYVTKNHLANSDWNAEMPLPVDWHLNVIQHHELFKELQSTNYSKKDVVNIPSTVENLIAKEIRTKLQQTDQKLVFSENGYKLVHKKEDRSLLDVRIYNNTNSIQKEVLFRLLKGNLIPNIAYAAQRHENNMGAKLKASFKEHGLLTIPEQILKERLVNATKINESIKDVVYFKDKNCDAVANYNNDVNCVEYVNINNKLSVDFPQDIIDFTQQNYGTAVDTEMEKATSIAIEKLLKAEAVRQIFRSSDALTNYPIHLFDNDSSIKNQIQKLEADGYNIVIKNCLPKSTLVVGVLMVNYRKLSYSFQLLAGQNITENVKEMLFNQNIKWHSLDSLKMNGNTQNEYFNTLNETNPCWPSCILEIGESEIELPQTVPTSDYLNHLSNTVKKEYGDIWVRTLKTENLIVADVLIDQIKDIICLTPSPEWYQLIKDYHKQLPLLSSMAKASTHDLKNLCKSLNIYYSFFKGSYKIHDLLFLNTSEEWMKIETEIFMTMLNYRVGNIQEAHNFINNYITDRKEIFTNLDGAKGRNMEALYLSCTKDYLKHKSLNKTEEQTFLSLATNFGKKLAEEICCDFEKPENIFQSYDLPSHLIEIGPQSNVKEILFFLNKLIKIESYENMPC